MAGRLIQPDCEGRNCTDTCGTPTVTAGACVSREGNGNLRGFSKYQNENSGDWNRRKALTESLVGTWTELAWPHDDCTVGDVIDPCVTGQSRTSTTPWQIDPATNTFVSGSGDFTYSDFVYSGDCEYSGSGSGTEHPYLADGLGTAGYDAITVFTDDTASPDYPCVGEGLGAGSFSYPSVFVHTRSDFDTVFAALGRGSPTTGSSCRSTAGTIGSTNAGSATQIAITGTRAPQIPLACANLTAATDYTVTVEIDRYAAGGGSYVDTITDEITFTAAGTTEDIDYDVPVNTDYDYAYAGVSIAAA